MPNTKISALTAGDPAQGTDQIPVARAGTNVKITAASVAALAPAGTVTSVGLSGGTTGLTVSGTNPITASGTFTLAGTLALANGGTGQTTKAAAFNALSPVTTTGDLIIGNGTNSNTRLAIGTNGYYLQSNGSTASWQALSVSAGSISGTLQAYQGGTGTGTTPSNGQLLIGNGGGYSVANLTAGTGISITNSFGGITIAAAGGGPTISVLSVSTSFGSFNNSPPSSTYSKPLIGNATSPSNYGAFAFLNTSGGYNVTSAGSMSSISGLDSTGAAFNYTSPSDFSHSGQFTVMDSVVSCYGVIIYSSAMQTLFASSKAAITTPSLAPLDASTAYGGSNPYIYVSDGTNDWDNTGSSSPSLGIVVSKSGSNYYVNFGTENPTNTFGVSVTNIQFTINSSFSSYFSGSDFTVFTAQNNNNAFSMQISVSNPTLQTLLNNSFL